ncbi:host attachment family protein, partial [Escherichia coli]|nr:host attachment family protein [Escherichia coli]
QSGSMGETDFHQQEEDRFAAETADMLKRRALANDFESLVIIAPPRTLGELRKHYHKEDSDRLKGELAKDLTGHPVADIEKALQSA